MATKITAEDIEEAFKAGVASQQQKIEELEAHVTWLERHCLELIFLDSPPIEVVQARTQEIVDQSMPLSLAHIKREASDDPTS